MDFILESVFDEQKDHWLITLSGEIDIFNSNDMKTRIAALLDEKGADIFIDCKGLDYIDSTGLGALVGVLKNVKALGKEMHLMSVKTNILKLFRITNLDKVLVIEKGGEDNE
jgi:anti-sigma B factor antagonist